MELRDLPKYETLQALARQFPDADPGMVETCLVLLRTAGDVFAAFDAHFARQGISRGRFSVLMILFRNPEFALSPAELAEKTGVTRATMTGLLDCLEHDGFVRRDKDAVDRRGLRIRLTPRGKSFLKKILPDHFRRVAALMSNLNKKEQKELSALLEKVQTGIPALRDA